MCLWTLAVALRRSLQVTQTIPNARLRALYSPPSHKVCLPGGELERFEMRAWQVLAPSRRPLPCNRTCDRVLQLYLLSHLSLGRYRLRGYLKKLSTIYPRVFPEQKNRKGIDTRFFRTRPRKKFDQTQRRRRASYSHYFRPTVCQSLGLFFTVIKPAKHLYVSGSVSSSIGLDKDSLQLEAP
jgi:hypothetical protein